MSVQPIDITAAVEGADPRRPDAVTTVRGQVQVASTRGEVLSVSLEPARPSACPEALRAIEAADWVVLGPGSWFTSVIPHLLVPDLKECLIRSPARKAVNLNLVPQRGETEGFSARRHLEVLAGHAPDLRLDVVLADRGTVDDPEVLESYAESLGARLVLADVAADDRSPRHDPVKLAKAFTGFLRDA
jgi:uncharacterized cofD-like protein